VRYRQQVILDKADIDAMVARGLPRTVQIGEHVVDIVFDCTPDIASLATELDQRQPQRKAWSKRAAKTIKRRVWTKTQKREAVRRVEAGEKAADVARALQISDALLSTWRKNGGSK